MILIRHRFTGQVLHSLPGWSPLYPLDLHGQDLSNVVLNCAELSYANLESACLRGAKLREACLQGANLKGADLSYTDLLGATLVEANCEGTLFYLCQMPKDAGAFSDATVTPETDIDMPPRPRFRWR